MSQIGSAVWPESQQIKSDFGGIIHLTHFADHEAYHPGLIAKILERDGDPEAHKNRNTAASGTKIYDLHLWNCPEADLIDARAAEFFRRALKQDDAFVFSSWANVSRQGDYIMPHAHPNAMASIVYALEPGEANPNDARAGSLAIVDPRFSACCRADEGYMTTPYMPKMPPGTMILFPSTLVHCVNPYRGQQPRITIAWDMNAEPSAAAPPHIRMAQ